MRITKFGHACIRIEHAGKALVIDPGMWTEPEAIDGADTVLITHEHPDHADGSLLRRTDAPILTVHGLAAKWRNDEPDLADRATVVKPGEVFGAVGLSVTAVGEQHAVIHPELPLVSNSGYLISDGTTKLFHPGDALTGPAPELGPVDVLCLPVSAPWLKVSEAIDFGRSVGATRNLAIHDKVYSAEGLGVIDGHFGRFLGAAGQDYVRLAVGTDLA